MGKSDITDYFICYLREHEISSLRIARRTGISEQKLRTGYTQPLLADEFLELCVALRLSPEKIASDIAKQKSE